MEEKYKKFLEVDWSTNDAWQNYFANITPTPPGSRVLHYKKKFYKFRVDNDFDITWEPPIQTNQQTSGPQQQGGYRPNYSAPFTGNFVPLYGNTIISKSVACIEILMWIASTTLIFMFHDYSLKASCATLCIRVFRRIGKPKFNIEYAQTLFLDEHLHLLMYMLLLMIDRHSIYTTIPFLITSILNISDFCRHYGIITALMNKIVNKRTILCELRSNSELMLGVIMIIGIFFGVNGFFLPIFYWQFLRFKYIFNTDSKISFGKLNSGVNTIKPKLPRPVRWVVSKIQQLFDFLGRTETKEGQAAGGANCLIF